MNGSPSEEGHDDAPPFTPTVEGGVSPLEESFVFPQNYFLLVDMRRVVKTNIDYPTFMVQNLIRGCLRIFGSGNFQIWENPISLCLRLSCSEKQLEEFLGEARETARIWGASEHCITLYHSDYPKVS